MDLSNENDVLLNKLKENLEKLSKEQIYHFNDGKDDKKYLEQLDEFRRLPRTFVGQMIEKLDIRFENDIIYITDIMLGFLEALSILPIEYENMSDTGTYEVYLNNEPWAVIEYKGMPKNDPESNIVHFGAITQLTLNQLVKRVVIDLEIPGGNEDDSSKDEDNMA